MRGLRAVISRLSTRARLTAVSVVVAAVVFAIGAVIVYQVVALSLSDAVTDELRVRADDVAAELDAGAPVTTGGPVVAQVVTTDGEVVVPAGAEPIVDLRDIGVLDGGGAVVVDRHVPGIGEDARVLAERAPTEASDRVVVVAGSTSVLRETRERLVLVLALAFPVLMVAIAATAWLAAGAALRTVRQMSRRAARLSLARSDARLPRPPGNDEVAQLGETLNEMLDRLSETMAHERVFIDNASHELRTPLAVLRAELELALADARRGAADADVTRALASALEETDHLCQLAADLLVLARADSGEPREAGAIPLRALAVDVAASLPRHGVSIDVTGDEVSAWTQRSSVERIVRNLLVNAVRHADARVLVRIRARRRWAVLEVLDDGDGFEPRMLAQAMDRFAIGDDRGGDERAGTGLGLSIVAAEAGSWGGRARLGNGRALGGAWVEVQLPLAPAPNPTNPPNPIEHAC